MVWLFLSFVSVIDLRIATAGVKGAYVQSGPIKRDFYVRPPKQFCQRQRTAWKLPRLPYGFVEVGRHWLFATEEWLLQQYGCKQVAGIEQLFYKKGIENRIVLLVDKILGDFLMAGKNEVIAEFLRCMDDRFKL